MLRKLYRAMASRPHSDIVKALNKILITWGMQPLFSGTRKQLHAYWMNTPENDNQPTSYLEGRHKSEYLLSLVQRFGTRDDFILELGCNVGRNLFYMWQSGYSNISGIEINGRALEMMCTTFPVLSRISVFNGLLEDVLPKIKDKKFDIIFSMAVLEHIHPRSNFIFKEIVRTCRKYIITIEIEDRSSARVFPRNYQKVFEKLGCPMVYHENLKGYCLDLDAYTARVFQIK